MSFDDREKPTPLLARRLVRTTRTATLATIDAETGGGPYASLALTAAAHDGSPILVLSDLARHARNIAADARVSLLFAKMSNEAISQSRSSVIGRAVRSDDANLRARFRRRHFADRDVLAFDDFHLYRVAVESVHFIGGFGRVETLPGAEAILDLAGRDALASAETEIVAHMNRDHLEAVRLFANNLAGRPGLDWHMTGIDPEGIDLARHSTETRIDFETLVTDAEAARADLVHLAHRARGAA